MVIQRLMVCVPNATKILSKEGNTILHQVVLWGQQVSRLFNSDELNVNRSFNNVQLPNCFNRKEKKSTNDCDSIR